MLKLTAFALALAAVAGAALAADVKTPAIAPDLPSVDNTSNNAMLKCHPISFKTAEVIGDKGARVLRVTVAAPKDGVRLRLEPVVYIKQPDYWQIGLVSCHPDDRTVESGTATVSTVDLPLGGSIGLKGIDVFGATGTEHKRFELAPL